MATKTWLPTTASTWNTANNWSPSGIPVAGDAVLFTSNITSSAGGVVTLSTTAAQPGSIRFADSAAAYFSWQLTGSADVITYGTGTTVSVANAPSIIWNNISGTAPLIVDATIANFLSLSGSSNTFTGGVKILSGALRIAADTSLGPVPATLNPLSVIMNTDTALITSNSANYISPSTRGFFLSGTSTISSSYGASPFFYIHGPITGSGQIIFSSYASTGSTLLTTTLVHLTGANSSIQTSGGIRIESTQDGRLFTSGSRNIGSASIEFRNKGTSTSGNGGILYFYEDPSRQVNTMSGDISWTGPVASGATTKALSSMLGSYTQDQTHVYSGRLSTQAANVGSIQIGSNAGIPKILTVVLSGDNSGLYGVIRPMVAGPTNLTFVGSQSLPAPTSRFIVSSTTSNTGSGAGNLTFSGTMTFPNPIESSDGAGQVGTKLNVPAGNVVTATGRHGITGSLVRQGSGANLAWSATSFVGPGEWIQSGTVAGAGSLVIEPGSRLTLATNANTFTGNLSASNGVLTIGAGGGDLSFGAVPGASTTKYIFQNSTLASSASFQLDANRGIGVTGSMIVDVLGGQSVMIKSPIVGFATAAPVIRKIGSGNLILSGVNTFTGSIYSMSGTLTVAGGDLSLGFAASRQNWLYLSGGTTLASSQSFTMDSNRLVQIGRGAITFDVLDGTSMTIPTSMSFAGASSFNITGGGTFTTPVIPFSGSKGVGVTGYTTRLIFSSSDFGPAPASIDPAYITFPTGTTSINLNSSVVAVVISGTQGIYLSGTGILSGASTTSATAFYVHSPISGPGQLIMAAWNPTGSQGTNGSIQLVLTGANSALNNDGGVSLRGNLVLTLGAKNSTVLGTKPIEYVNNSNRNIGGGTNLIFYSDSTILDDTIVNDINCIGPGAGAKSITGYTLPTDARILRFTGNMSAPGHTGSISLGATVNGGSNPITYIFSGNNNNFYGSIATLGGFSSNVTFVGSQSLPNPSVTLKGGWTTSTAASGSDRANLTFSGSMILSHALDLSSNLTSVGAKVNVPSGDTITHVGTHYLSASLAGAISSTAWSATSFRGPGEWIQSGTLTGPGGFVVTENARVTLANNSNTFTGGIYALTTGSLLAISSDGGDNSFGATPDTPRLALKMYTGARVAFSSSFEINQNRRFQTQLGGVFDISQGNTINYAGVISNGNVPGSFEKAGPGTLILSGTNTYTGGTIVSSGTLDIAKANSIASGSVTVKSGSQLRASNTLDATILIVSSSLVLSGGSITIG